MFRDEESYSHENENCTRRINASYEKYIAMWLFLLFRTDRGIDAGIAPAVAVTTTRSTSITF